ncbi:unnamed protein product [Lupinus luteus]|uniref:MRG domain-containing protein n=1 Tax=Lupinus luteus TaxID=3873 RepID=A0AAV1YA33_LUPLU
MIQPLPATLPPPIPNSILPAINSSHITVLESMKPRFKRLKSERMSGDTLFTTFWDEWVGEDRLMKYTEENVMKQRALNKKQNVDKNVKSGRSSQPKAKISVDAKVDKEDARSNVSKVKKQKHDSGVECGLNYRKGSVTVEKLVKIQIPATLKKQLMDDWTFITQQDKLVKLPRSPTIDDILTKYLDYKTKKDDMDADSIGESLKGIRRYFDRALPIMLLYKKERKQYSEAIVDGVSPSSIYGAEHLLRLFVKLPELLAYVNIEEETLNSLQQIFLDFLKFLQKNQSTFFQHMIPPKSQEEKVRGKKNENTL